MCLLSSAQVHADTTIPEKQKFHLDEKSENAIGYSHAVRVGHVVYISGSVGAGPMPDAIHAAYEELRKTLTQLDEFIKHKDLRRAYYKEDFPAATWVQVARLYVPELVLEVELTAVIPTYSPRSSESR